MTVPHSLDRASAADLMQFATGDGRAAGHIGAILLLDAAPGFSVEQARRVLSERIRTVPKLRQRLYRAPPGCSPPMPGEAGCAGPNGPDQARRARRVACAGSARA